MYRGNKRNFPEQDPKKMVVDLLKQLLEADTGERPDAVKVYNRVDMDNMINIQLHWEVNRKDKGASILGLRIFYALKNCGRAHHSIWIADEKCDEIIQSADTKNKRASENGVKSSTKTSR